MKILLVNFTKLKALFKKRTQKTEQYQQNQIFQDKSLLISVLLLRIQIIEEDNVLSIELGTSLG